MAELENITRVSTVAGLVSVVLWLFVFWLATVRRVPNLSCVPTASAFLQKTRIFVFSTPQAPLSVSLALLPARRSSFRFASPKSVPASRVRSQDTN